MRSSFQKQFLYDKISNLYKESKLLQIVEVENNLVPKPRPGAKSIMFEDNSSHVCVFF